MTLTLGELAVRFGCELRGDPDLRVASIATLDGAGPGSLCFFANPRLRDLLRATRATAVVLDRASAAQCPTAALIVERPHAAFARMAELLHPLPVAAAGAHPSAVLSADAQVASSAHVGAVAVIGARARIGERAYIGPGCVIGDDVVIGDDARFIARVTVCDGVTIGARCIAHPGAVIGSDGFGFAPDRGTWIKVPQVGSVRIGDDVEIGANTTIDRGAIEDTVIAEGVKLDNQIQVGHNVRIGAHTAIAGCVGIAGSAIIGARCQIAGGAGIAGHLTICDDVVVTAAGTVLNDIREPGVYANAVPVEPFGEWRRIQARIKRLDRMADRLAAVERQLKTDAATRGEEES
jgi:UDP-3-O-[3-hydroxymyristoyl] glucosamine N-acyltransferase